MSLRDPGSFVDEANPGARVGYGRFFRGSGSSQAAAIVSGAVATLLSQRPQLSPDEIKALLMRSAVRLPNADPVAQGSRPDQPPPCAGDEDRDLRGFRPNVGAVHRPRLSQLARGP